MIDYCDGAGAGCWCWWWWCWRRQWILRDPKVCKFVNSICVRNPSFGRSFSRNSCILPYLLVDQHFLNFWNRKPYPYAPCMEYLPTFALKITKMWVNIPAPWLAYGICGHLCLRPWGKSTTTLMIFPAPAEWLVNPQSHMKLDFVNRLISQHKLGLRKLPEELGSGFGIVKQYIYIYIK